MRALKLSEKEVKGLIFLIKVNSYYRFGFKMFEELKELLAAENMKKIRMNQR
jgi:hypothetical protein